MSQLVLYWLLCCCSFFWAQRLFNKSDRDCFLHRVSSITMPESGREGAKSVVSEEKGGEEGWPRQECCVALFGGEVD